MKSSPGDSGAPVVTEDGKLVGLLFAGANDQTFVMPIQPILAALKVELGVNRVKDREWPFLDRALLS